MTSSADFLRHLNPAQRQAVEHFCGPLLVVAGAGSGKTRALTFRIFNLVQTHRVDPENILAVTFTNKAAREMKDRIEKLFAEFLAQQELGKTLSLMTADEQMRLRSQVYKTYTKGLWIGTFHSLCSRILRLDIEKYQDDHGRKWDRNFSIFDDSDAQRLVKDIVINQLNLDEKRFEPKSVRYAISNAKNRGESPEDLERNQPNYRGRVIAEVYNHYQTALAANNALDFDDLIWLPVQLFRQNELVLDYWHRRFRHILVDEYQDTNRTQYDLIRLLATNGMASQNPENWNQRSLFVVGDADQSIYSFREADFTILMDFQKDFGDGQPDAHTKTMVKLEENYRSTETILIAANALIENNTERIDKVLKPTRDPGEPIFYHQAEHELDEAEFVVRQITSLVRKYSEALNWGSFAILYRTNAQSRAFEEALVQFDTPYNIVGGLRFYDRKEVKDVLAYLRAIANPLDSVSLLRVINSPKRGVGKTTLDSLIAAAQQLNVPLWEILSDETSVKTLAGRSAKGVLKFAELIQAYRTKLTQESASSLVQGLLEDSGYVEDLKLQGTDEATERLGNVLELYNAVLQFEENNEEVGLLDFLNSASLASDLDNLQEGDERVALMTLHGSKGLEFPIVFLVGLEQSLFPSYRSLQDPASLEEERRLCYVGITRAQERLFLTHARERRLWGSREPAIASQFLSELPRELLETNAAAARSLKQAQMASTVKPQTSLKTTIADRTTTSTPGVRVPTSIKPAVSWKVGDRVLHPKFGVGQVTHLFGTAPKITVAVKFTGLGQKIIDPGLVGLQKLD